MTPSNKPQNINKYCWYYEHKNKIEIVIESRDANDKYLFTQTIYIPKSKLMRSLSRMNARPAQKGEMK